MPHGLSILGETPSIRDLLPLTQCPEFLSRCTRWPQAKILASSSPPHLAWAQAAQ